MRLIALSMSPRKGGNTETLLEAFIGGARKNEVECRVIRTHDSVIKPCTGCGACEKTGACVIRDDFDGIREALIIADCIIFATPLYFMNAPASGKAFIDRCQAFWAAKHRLGIDLFGGRSRRGYLLSCAGARRGPDGSDLFRGLRDTMTYVYDSLGLAAAGSVLVPHVDSKGEIGTHGDMIEKARRLGRECRRD